jgi:hypothetical protein
MHVLLIIGLLIVAFPALARGVGSMILWLFVGVAVLGIVGAISN